MAQLANIAPPLGEDASSGVSRWFYFKDKKRRGPVEAEELQTLFDKGSLPGDALVRPDQFRAEWRPASEVDFFSTPEVARPSSMPPAPPGSPLQGSAGTVVNGSFAEGTLNDSWERNDGFEMDGWATGAQIRPWVRYWARFFDLTMGGIFVGFAMGLTMPPWVFDSRILSGLIFLLIWIVVEGAMLSTLGWTPGKWLLNVRVRDRSGDKVGFGTGMRRTGWAMVMGMAAGFHILALAALIWSYFSYKEHGDTRWDRGLELDVEHREIPAWKVVLYIFLLLAVPTLFVMGVLGLAVLALMAEGAI
ncbi:MAG TPA: RDD family protein [Acidobacteriota bacterium]|nr:RDD family protein [Acidobacteriota bacterium]